MTSNAVTTTAETITAVTTKGRRTSPACDDGLPVVAVYRDDLLLISEGFIAEPLAHLQRHRAVLVGSRRVPGLPLDPSALVLTDGPGLPRQARIAAFRALGGAGLHRRLARQAPVLVHAHFGLDAVQALPLAKRRGIPLVATFHGYDIASADASLAGSHRGRRYLARRRELAQSAALLLPVSEFLRMRMLRQGFPEDRVRRHYLGVDTTYFAPDDRPRSGILFVGRLVRSKGADHVMRALAEVARRHPHTVLTVVGDGPQRGELEELARSLRVNVEFRGAQPRAVVRELMAGAAVMCTGSHAQPDGYAEAFGLTNLEAQAMGVPVVGYASGGVPEAVADGATGLLVREGDVRGLATALESLLTDPQTALRLGRQGRDRAVAEFDMTRQVAALEALYEEVVAP